MRYDKDVTEQFSSLTTEITMTPEEFGEVWDRISHGMKNVKPRTYKRKRYGFAAGVAAVAAVAVVAGGLYLLSNHTLLNTTTADHHAQDTTPGPNAEPLQKAPPLTTISMVNDTLGWATGHGTVWFTRDGGVHWQNVSPEGLPSSSTLDLRVFGIGEKDAWITAVDSSTVSNPVAIYHTSDAGQSWVKQAFHDAGNVTSLQFRDDQHGWIALLQGAAMGSERETVYQTADGGSTWNMVSVTNDVQNGTLPFAGDKTGVTFIDDHQGWATGFTPVDGQIYLYSTVDAGQTWQQQQLAVPRGIESAEFTSNPPVFFNQHEGILPVSFGLGLISYKTSDGGKTWLPGNPVMSTVQNQAIQGWSFPNMNDGFATDGTKLFTTTDGGQSWTSFTPNISMLDSIKLIFTSPKNGWLLTTAGILYRSQDGGHTWKRSN